MRSAKIATAAAEINYLLNEIKTSFMLKEKYLAEARTKLLEMQNMVFDTNLIIAQHDPKLIDIFSSYVLEEVDESLRNIQTYINNLKKTYEEIEQKIQELFS